MTAPMTVPLQPNPEAKTNVIQTAAARDAARATSRSIPRISFLDIASTVPEAEAAPLLLLHGVGSSSETWLELIPLLDGRRIIAPDYRGHGASDSPQPPYAMDDFVEDALRLLDELGVERVHVAGFSIGALFAERLAILEPARVVSLVLLSSIADRTDAERARAANRLAQITSTPPAQVAPASAERWFTPEFRDSDPVLVQREIDIVSSVDHAPYAASYKVLVENDPVDIVEAITCPTLIMTGELDEGSTPAMSQALHRRIRESRLVIVPNVKHYVHVELPATVAGEINAMLGDLDPVIPPPGGLTEVSAADPTGRRIP